MRLRAPAVAITTIVAIGLPAIAMTAVHAEGTYPPSAPPTRFFPGPTNSESPNIEGPRKVPNATVTKKKTNSFVPGRYQTLIRRVSVPEEDRAKYSKPTYRVTGRAVRPSAAGQTSYFVYRVTSSGGLQVKVFGPVPMRINAVIVLRPKSGYRKQYGPIVQNETWTLKPAR